MRDLLSAKQAPDLARQLPVCYWRFQKVLVPTSKRQKTPRNSSKKHNKRVAGAGVEHWLELPAESSEQRWEQCGHPTTDVISAPRERTILTGPTGTALSTNGTSVRERLQERGRSTDCAERRHPCSHTAQPAGEGRETAPRPQLLYLNGGARRQ